MGIDFGAIVNELNNLAPVKLVREALSLADPGKRPAVDRAKLQRDVQAEFAKAGATHSPAKEAKPIPKLDERAKALANEGLGHYSRTAKLEAAGKKYEELVALGKYKNVGEMVQDLEASVKAKAGKDNVKKFVTDHRSKSFKDATDGIISGKDARTIDDLKAASDDQLKQMGSSIDASSPADGNIADFVAEEALLAMLKTRKASEDLTTAKDALMGSKGMITTEKARIENRSLKITARLLDITEP